MNTQPTNTVREIALNTPGATRVFERLGIDYCCGGAATLTEACATAGLSPEEVLRTLEREAAPPDDSQPDVNALGLAELCDYIVKKHHVFTKNEVSRLSALLDKVVNAHGERHAELARVREHFRALAAELAPHMMKEEMILFPYVAQLEAAAREGRPAPRAPFGTVRNPVRMMAFEHDNAGELLRSIRRASAGFKVPSDGCVSYQTLYSALEEFERDLHQHIHLENNVLFPRAVELESSLLN